MTLPLTALRIGPTRLLQQAAGSDGPQYVKTVVPCVKQSMGERRMSPVPTREAFAGLRPLDITREEFNRKVRAVLNAFMVASNITNKQMERALGVGRGTVSYWRERGEVPPWAIAQFSVMWGAVFWVAIYNDFGIEMKKRFERKVAAERQALHDWSFMTQQDTGT